jgi:rare lipoprotein A
MLRRIICLIAALTLATAALAAEPASLQYWATTVIPEPAASAPEKSAPPQGVGENFKHLIKGLASFYWQGEKTASGEPFDKAGMTAAHPTLPFNTLVKVTRVDSGQSVVVRINDRGPFKPGRVIDVSQHAAQVLGFEGRGLAQVELEVVSP